MGRRFAKNPKENYQYLYVDEDKKEWVGTQMTLEEILKNMSDISVLENDEDMSDVVLENSENMSEIDVFEDEEAAEKDLLEKNSECIKWYDDYLSGVLSKSEYIEKMYLKLEGFIKYFLQKQGLHSQTKEDYEDMVASGVQTLVEDLDKYDPRKSMPTTWFGRRLFKCIKHPSGMSAHYVNVIRKLNKVAREYGYEDANDIRLEPHRLARLAEMPLITVTKALQLNSVNVITDSDALQQSQVGATSLSPESVYLEKERTEYVSKLFDILSPLEKMVISMYVNDEDDFDEDGKKTETVSKSKSDAKILKEINTPKNLKLFKLKKPLNPQSLNKIKNVALMKMREHSGSYLFENNERAFVSEHVEQADTEDIMVAFEEGILFD